jgi:crotonyl-CoA carboxylase/reductase
MSAVTKLQTGPKDLYEIGEIPPLGHVPPKMYAWAIRRERHGPGRWATKTCSSS